MSLEVSQVLDFSFITNKYSLVHPWKWYCFMAPCVRVTYVAHALILIMNIGNKDFIDSLIENESVFNTPVLILIMMDSFFSLLYYSNRHVLICMIFQSLYLFYELTHPGHYKPLFVPYVTFWLMLFSLILMQIATWF